MIERVRSKLPAWSVRAYVLILQAYPCSFRREFGESMTQVFRDLARDAWKGSGLLGLAALWRRTVVDWFVSLVDAYAGERRKSMFRRVVAAGVLYVCALGVAVGYGAIRFGEFYQPPAFSRFAAPAAHEDALMAAYEEALTGEFGQYRAFVVGAGLVLAVWLGIASSLFGLYQKSLLHGAAAFIAGTALTVAAFELLPSIWFPFDNYAVGFIWLLRGFPVAAVAWLLATMIGRFRRGRARPASSMSDGRPSVYESRPRAGPGRPHPGVATV